MIQQDIDLKKFNTLAVSAKGRYFARVENQQQLQEALAFSKQQDLPVLLLGGGSNLILTQDYSGLVIQIALKGIEWREIDADWVQVTAQAGENWHQFVEYCLHQGAFGLENLALIPGTVGAAPIQNIGAYGVEITDYMESLRAYDRETEVVREFSCEGCGFGYRDSIFKSVCRDRFVILSVTFRLRRIAKLQLSYGALAQSLAHLDSPSPEDLFNAVVDIRQSKLPDPQQLANAGSFFKNPVVSREHFQRLQQKHPEIVAYPDPQGMKLAAGWLIDHSGWKGYRQGDVGVHERQALVLVNYGTASGEQILDLAGKIQNDIRQRFDVELEIEPRCY